jgi:hypothetical protein
MAHMQLGRPNKWLLKVASGLADLLEASIIGVAVYRPHPIPYGDYYLGAAALNRYDFAKELFDAEPSSGRGSDADRKAGMALGRNICTVIGFSCDASASR